MKNSRILENFTERIIVNGPNITKSRCITLDFMNYFEKTPRRDHHHHVMEINFIATASGQTPRRYITITHHGDFKNSQTLGLQHTTPQHDVLIPYRGRGSTHFMEMVFDVT